MDPALIGLVVLLVLSQVWERRNWAKDIKQLDADYLAHIARQEAEHLKERRELMTRIQRPEMVPVAQRPARQRPPRDHSAMGKIGTVAPPKQEE